MGESPKGGIEDPKQTQADSHTKHENPLVIESNQVHTIRKLHANLCDPAAPCPLRPPPKRTKQVNLSCLNNSRQKVKAVINSFKKRFSRSKKDPWRLSKAKSKNQSPEGLSLFENYTLV